MIDMDNHLVWPFMTQVDWYDLPRHESIDTIFVWRLRCVSQENLTTSKHSATTGPSSEACPRYVSRESLAYSKMPITTKALEKDDQDTWINKAQSEHHDGITK